MDAMIERGRVALGHALATWGRRINTRQGWRVVGRVVERRKP